jgi:hypothetical protein
VVDMRTNNLVRAIPGVPGITGLEYVPGLHKVNTSNWGEEKIGKDEIVKVLRFDSETGTPGYDSVAKRIYVTLRSNNEAAEIDPSTDRVIGRYPVEGCGFNHGMAVDSEHHRAFLLCGETHNLTVFSLDGHKAIAHFPMPAGADAVKIRPGEWEGLRRMFEWRHLNRAGRQSRPLSEDRRLSSAKSSCTVLPLIPRLIAYMHRSRKRMAGP